MDNSDIVVVLLAIASLTLLCLFAAIRDAHIRHKEKTAEAVATVTRGEKSMSALYTVYGATIASWLVLIDNAEGLTGHKVIFIVIGFLCLSYLFFLSSWFRNAVFFTVAHRIRVD